MTKQAQGSKAGPRLRKDVFREHFSMDLERKSADLFGGAFHAMTAVGKDREEKADPQRPCNRPNS